MQDISPINRRNSDFATISYSSWNRINKFNDYRIFCCLNLSHLTCDFVMCVLHSIWFFSQLMPSIDIESNWYIEKLIVLRGQEWLVESNIHISHENSKSSFHKKAVANSITELPVDALHSGAQKQEMNQDLKSFASPALIFNFRLCDTRSDDLRTVKLVTLLMLIEAANISRKQLATILAANLF